jgi:SAM-dependent methyltransferase
MILSKRSIVFLLISVSLIAAYNRASDATVEESISQSTSTIAQAPTTVPPSTLREPDVVYVPTPQEVVDRMLEIAKVNRNDVLYDLGSGDGRIPITAAQKFGIKAVGIDINPLRIKEANANAQKAGVADRVTFLNQDLFQSNFSDATVVTLYLLPSLNVQLRPQLFRQLKPGTRIVSHDFNMGEWKPERTEQMEVNGATRTIYFWTIPANPPANLR